MQKDVQQYCANIKRASGLTMRLIGIVIITIFASGCTNLSAPNEVGSKTGNPLKTQKDIEIEKAITSGVWKYERQGDDCKDTTWEQTFYKNRYYKSVGAACLVPDAFSVDAENWHIKDQYLYVTNLSPVNGDDIILKYRIDFLNQDKLILASGKFKYNFYK